MSKRNGRAFHLYLDREMADAVEALADKMGRSVSDELRSAIARHLKRPPVYYEPPLSGGASARPAPASRPARPLPQPPVEQPCPDDYVVVPVDD